MTHPTLQPYGADRLWPFARGSGPTLLLGTALWGSALALARRRPGALTRALAGSLGLIWGLLLYFFRDPHRRVLAEPGLVVGPGDGRVVEIWREREESYLRQEAIRVSLFLSLFDVHVQRSPIAGEVVAVEHRPGRYLQAFRPEASQENESLSMHLRTPYGPILVRQIAGILARRCVNYARPGDHLATGERFGLIRFGSRIDLFLPPSAELLLEVGDRVYGGLTPVARLTAPSRPPGAG